MRSKNDNTIVIIGGGIIGCATAYYLSRDTGRADLETIHIVESSTELFSSASGKAGGFLAEDWFASEVSSLGALSFRLHCELAEKFDGYHRWGFSRSTGSSLVNDIARNSKRGEDWLRNGGSRADATGDAVHEAMSIESEGLSRPAWLTRREGDRLEIIGDEGGVAQVDPLRLSRFLLDKSIEAGVTLHQPVEAVRLTHSDDEAEPSTLTLRRFSKSSAEDEGDSATTYTIPCGRLLFAAGAWTPSAFRTLFPRSTLTIPISPLAGHSIVVRSPYLRTAADERPHCHAIFTTLLHSAFSPEIFSRIGDEIYIAGLNSAKIPLPKRAEDAHVDEKSIAQLLDVAKDLIKSKAEVSKESTQGEENRALAAGAIRGEVEIMREGLCFRPVTRNGLPIVARVEEALLGWKRADDGFAGKIGVFVAAGHGPWGISQSLGTGLVMAEMLSGRTETSADISELGFD